MLTNLPSIADKPWIISYFEHIRTIYAQGKLAHAQLLCGPQGIGKFDLAQALAQLLLCVDSSSSQPCGRCKGCLLYSSGNHPDTLFITQQENKNAVGVDVIRSVIEGLSLRTHQGVQRVVLIERIETLTIAASNALLKILEEPPQNTFFVATSNNPGLLLTTVRSRFTHVQISPPKLNEALTYVCKVSNIEKTQVKIWLGLMQGSPLALVEVFANNHMLIKTQTFNLFMFSYDGLYDSLVNVVARLAEYPFELTLDMLTSYIRDMLVLRFATDDVVVIHQDVKDQLALLGSRCNPQALFGVYDHILHLQESIACGITLHQHTQLHALTLEIHAAISRDRR